MYAMDPEHPDREAIEKAGQILRRGGLVAFPTETVYGLGGDALNPESSRKIYAAKGRPSDNPLIVHIARTEDLYKLCDDIPEEVFRLGERFWPGPLTMIMKKSKAVPYETTGGLDTVAVRMPSHPVALALIRSAGGFVAAPSANASGRPSPTRASHVYEDLAGRIECILDGGEVGIGVESTIVDLSVTPPMILRPGYITREDLEEVLGSVGEDATMMKGNGAGAPKAPGMRYRHYAPRGHMVIVEGEAAAVADYINRRVKECREEGRKTGVLCTRESAGTYGADVIKPAGHAGDEEETARHLYGILRDFDEEAVEEIFSESFSSEGFGQAVMNRLLKAAGHTVIRV